MSKEREKRTFQGKEIITYRRIQDEIERRGNKERRKKKKKRRRGRDEKGMKQANRRQKYIKSRRDTAIKRKNIKEKRFY